MRQKHGLRRFSTRACVVLLAVLMVASTFVGVSIAPTVVNAAGSATLSGGESININLQDSSWQGSKIRVRFLNSGGTAVGTEQILTPSGNKVTVSGVSGAASIVVEKVNDSKNTVLSAMKSKISANSGKDVVFCEKSSGWSAIKVYAWNNTSNSHNADFPGADMDSVSGTMYFKAFNQGAFTNVIFNGGGDSTKTADLTLTKATASSPKYYDHKQNKWVVYTDVEATATASVADRYSDSLNDLYLTSKSTAKWSKYNSSTTKKTVYFKPNSAWSTAYVHYDDDDDEPFYTSVQMTKYSDSPLIFKADVYFDSYVSFSTGSDFKTSDKKDQGSIFNDEEEPVFVAKNRSWTTLENAMTTDIRPSDITISNNNFSSVTPTGGGKVVGFDAYYYDYYSNNERAAGWRKNLNDDDFSGAAGPDGSQYRMQFSNLNDDVKDVALSNNNWRYPLLFGDDHNLNSFITNYYNAINGSRSPAINHDYFNGANNSNFLGGDNHRSVMGLVKNSLKNGELMVTDTLKAPYFDNSWLMEKAQTEKEVLYILDDKNLGQNGIYANFWNSSGLVVKDIHPDKVTSSAVTIGGKTGILYRYVVDKNLKSVQLANSTNYSSNFWNYQENGEWVVSRFTNIVCTNGGDVSSDTYKSGIQRVTGSERAKIINAKFPFVETVDNTTKVKTYTFDSNGSSRKDNIQFDFDNNTLTYYNGNGVAGKLDNNNGFFPFNKKGTTPRNYGFGVRMDLEFTLPENGMLTSTKPAEFKYSGDDDVWVFVDGNLVLDLGGAHTPTTGTINFGYGTNKVRATADKVYTVLNEPNGSSVKDTLKQSSVSKDFTINNTDPTKKHQMTVFYMERGTNDSNLRIEFSIQPIQNELDVYKEVEVENVNAGIESEVEQLAQNEDFDFILKQDSALYGGSAGKTYHMRYADDSTGTETIKNGAFSLKHYDEAKFQHDTDLVYGSHIELSEKTPSFFNYNTDIEVNDIINGTSVWTGNITRNASFDFKNKLDDSGATSADERTILMAEFTNELISAPISLYKHLYKENTNELSNAPVPFEFTIKLDLDHDGTFEAYDLEYQYEGSSDIYVADNGTVHMRPDQVINFPDIPVGTPYQITEAYRAGYRNRAAGTVSGTVATTSNSVVFNNEEKPASQNLSVSKTLDGNTYTGTEFSFTAKLMKWIKQSETQTTGLEDIYAENTKTATNDSGIAEFDAFSVIPSNENKGDYIFRLTETDKSSSAPQYTYDNHTYYAKITVTEGSVSDPVYYSNEACTTLVGTDGKTPPVFANTTKKGTITVNKTDSNNQPVVGTQFALIKVSSESDVDSLLTPAAINALVEANQTAGDRVTLKRTSMNGANASAVFDNLPFYQSEGLFRKSGSEVVWTTDVNTSTKQVYCVFEYTPTEGFLPNYTKTYITLADAPSTNFTFGLVDAKVVMPNSSGSGVAQLMYIGFGLLGTGALLATGYAVKRKVKPRYVCRH